LKINNYKRIQGGFEPKGEKSASKLILISYIYLDRAQGQTFEMWDLTKGRLVRWENLIQHLNTLTVQKALQTEKIVKYLNPELRSPNMHKNSKWKFPAHLLDKDFIWCKIVVMNLVRVIGFLEDNIFYVVFLDEKHEFYPTEAK
jgi:hypothetical protein